MIRASLTERFISAALDGLERISRRIADGAAELRWVLAERAQASRAAKVYIAAVREVLRCPAVCRHERLRGEWFTRVTICRPMPQAATNRLRIQAALAIEDRIAEVCGDGVRCYLSVEWQKDADVPFYQEVLS